MVINIAEITEIIGLVVGYIVTAAEIISFEAVITVMVFALLIAALIILIGVMRPQIIGQAEREGNFNNRIPQKQTIMKLIKHAKAEVKFIFQ